jgi:hypothetical protein
LVTLVIVETFIGKTLFEFKEEDSDIPQEYKFKNEAKGTLVSLFTNTPIYSFYISIE